MPRSTTTLDNHHVAATPATSHHSSRISITPLAMSLGTLFVVSYVLCVLFDLWFPAYAMNPSWSPLLPGFTWISWSSFFLGLVETLAYGWYIALIFAPLYNFFAAKTGSAH